MQVSVSKSVLSALIRIAVEKGLMEDIQAPAFELFSEYAECVGSAKFGPHMIFLKRWFEVFYLRYS